MSHTPVSLSQFNEKFDKSQYRNQFSCNAKEEIYRFMMEDPECSEHISDLPWISMTFEENRMVDLADLLPDIRKRDYAEIIDPGLVGELDDYLKREFWIEFLKFLADQEVDSLDKDATLYEMVANLDYTIDPKYLTDDAFNDDDFSSERNDLYDIGAYEAAIKEAVCQRSSFFKETDDDVFLHFKF